MLTNREIKKLSRRLAKLIRDEITAKGLVDTGAMRSSVMAAVKLNKKGFEIELNAIEYYAYLDGDYNITRDALKSKAYKQLEKDIEKLFAEHYQQQLNKELKL